MKRSDAAEDAGIEEPVEIAGAALEAVLRGDFFEGNASNHPYNPKAAECKLLVPAFG